MSSVVILSWDPGRRELEFVEVNGGAGGTATRITVSKDVADDIESQLAGSALPRVADLEAEDEVVLIDSLSPVRVVRCAVKAVGRPDDRRFELRDKGRRAIVATIPAAVLGVTDTALAGAANDLEYLYAESLDPPGCWLGPEDGIGAFMAARRQAADTRKVSEQAAARRAQAPRRFVNPYTFVPFPQAVERAAPGGHHWLAPDRLSGAFIVTWTFVTQFQAPEGASGTTVLRLPGASVKGAVRSVHEVLAGGCLRVFDADFIPSYRDHAQTKNESWKLAVVNKATDDGQPLTVLLCEEVVWARDRQLQRACGGSLATGSRVTIRPGDVRQSSLGRKELAPDAMVGRGGDWVVLVTDSGTRRTKTDIYFLACGRVSSRIAEVSEAAWRAFRIAVAGARDVQERRRQGRDRAGGRPGRDNEHEEEKQPMKLVRFGSPLRPIDKRRVVTGWLWEGDVLWARTRNDGASVVVDELSLAALWRHPGWPEGQDPGAGDWSAGRRVPDDLLGCGDPGDLCPTCRVFGSADTRAREGDEGARQRAYAGHVRFGDACSEQPVELRPVQRAPLGMPRPGAGQFYLGYADDSPARKDRRPTREWGSDPDAERRRPLRGRKFYWHADPSRQELPRNVARPHQMKRPDQTPSELVATRHLAPAGTVLRQRVTFDNLSRAELGGLLAAFEPHRVLAAAGHAGPPGTPGTPGTTGTRDAPFLLHLGGGKPLGLGSCTAGVSDLLTWTAASRYGGAPNQAADPGECAREFAESCLPEVKDNVWPSLAAVLRQGTVDPKQVWYPPGEYWPSQREDPEAFDRPFAFFTASSGMHIEPPGKQRPLIPLPDPAGGSDQSLPIIGKEDLK